MINSIFFYKNIDIFKIIVYNLTRKAPIAQLDRASGYGPEGLGFESLWAHH